jgi:LuxR family maltose regulon positive regulatory protein
MTVDIASTKMRRPPVQASAIQRQRLHDRLDEDLELPITLVSAPAGFGKSTLVSQWLESVESPFAWLSLDERDSDLRGFLAHFVAAVNTAFVDALPTVSTIVEAVELPTSQSLASHMLLELDELDGQLVLVLDDYHVIGSSPANDLMTDLLQDPPVRMHLVLVSRRDPPLPMATLRGHGQLNELRMNDLRFTQSETRAYLEHELDGEVTAEAVASVTKRTEGWPVGVRLAARALRSGGGETNATASLSPFDERLVRDFFITEVLDRQRPVIRRHMLASSVLERFCAPLCEAIVDDPGSGKDFVDTVEREELFVSALGGEPRWFRYHDLIRDLLRDRLVVEEGLDGVASIHRAASGWLEAEGHLGEAIDETIAAGDIQTAGTLVARYGRQLDDGQNWPSVEALLQKIPREAIDADPALLVLEGWMLGNGYYRLRQMVDVLQRAAALIDRTPLSAELKNWVLGSIEALEGAFVDWMGGDRDRGVQRLGRACELLADEPDRSRTFAMMTRVAALQSTGDYAGAVALADSTIEDERFRGFPSVTFWSLSWAGWLQLDLETSSQHAAALLLDGERLHNADSITFGHYFLGTVAYARNQLSDAERRLGATADMRYRARPIVHAQSSFALALTHLAQQRPEQADSVADEAIAFALHAASEQLLLAAEALRAEVDLRLGRLNEAVLWADRVQVGPPNQSYLFYEPAVTLVSVLLAEGGDAARSKATDVLAEQEAFATRYHNHPALVRFGGLRALAREAEGDEAGALDALRTAVIRSQPSGAVRLLADLGPGLVGLLNRLEVEGETLAHVGAILGALEQTTAAGAFPQTTDAAPSVAGSAHVSRLTDREISILVLLDRRLTNKEIARELTISPTTVKKHAVNLYAKLHVHGRREAVAKARALGYLT